MTDKEVGELWNCASDFGCGNFSKNEVQRLIRKLVEERAARHRPSVHWKTDRSIKLALRDFGIPEDSWQEKP